MPMNETDDLRQQLTMALKSRALVYSAVYEELIPEVGAQRAEEILKRAIYKRGAAISPKFAPHAPADFAGLRDKFLDFVPDHGRLFAPEVRRCDSSGLDIKFHDCPLKNAWVEAGYDDETVATLCRIAGIVDNGTFENAGFVLDAKTWTPGDTGCCSLSLRPTA
jgi:L-2-amino-thiazoline-4-carboxylic acid hydrolase